MYRHVMIDLETMALTPNTAIVSIGACMFDPMQGVDTEDTFYEVLSWRDQDRYVDPGTKQWWKQQSKVVRQQLHGSTPLEEALCDLDFWLPPDCHVWGNGSIFDIAILEDAYRQHGLDIPWKFYNVYDMRTVKWLFETMRGGLDHRSGGTKHHALDDAIDQAQRVVKMLGHVTWS